MTIIQTPSPNFWKGRRGNPVIAVVLHIMDGSLSATDVWFKNPRSNVSSHYGVGKHGEIHQYVAEKDSAWGNGAVYRPSWKFLYPKINPNYQTIQIENEGHDLADATSENLNALTELIGDICNRWGIPINEDHIIGHWRINQRKPNCPSENCDKAGSVAKIIAMVKKKIG